MTAKEMCDLLQTKYGLLRSSFQLNPNTQLELAGVVGDMSIRVYLFPATSREEAWLSVDIGFGETRYVYGHLPMAEFGMVNAYSNAGHWNASALYPKSQLLDDSLVVPTDVVDIIEWVKSVRDSLQCTLILSLKGYERLIQQQDSDFAPLWQYGVSAVVAANRTKLENVVYTTRDRKAAEIIHEWVTHQPGWCLEAIITVTMENEYVVQITHDVDNIGVDTIEGAISNYVDGWNAALEKASACKL